MRLVVDSSFVIDHLRGEPAAIARWDQIFATGDEPIVNDIVACEVRAGLREKDEPELALLLEPVEFVQPGLETSMVAGRVRAEARSLGWTLSLSDALIAASAYHLDAAVLTRNVRDFSVTPVRVEPY